MKQARIPLGPIARVSLTVVAMAVTVQAQFTPATPFTGSHQEGFETQDTSAGPFPPCVVDRVFTGNADLCSSTGNGAHITGGWSFGCGIQEHSGTRLFGCTGGAAVFTFDTQVTKFGGYFGTNNPSVSDGKIQFYDAAGTLLHAGVVKAPNDCTWTWNGWDFGGVQVKRIEVSSNYSSGGYMMMDDLEADILPWAVGHSFCFCDGSAAPAPCGNQGITGRGCANSVFGQGAMLTATGVPSVSANTMVLHGRDVVGALKGVFFQGDLNLGNGMGVTLGDGLRCAGGNLQRLEVSFANGAGELDSSVDLATVNGLNMSPGNTCIYQLWYTDSSSGPCSTTYNLTNALEISWLP
jgi:hypothetical protein